MSILGGMEHVHRLLAVDRVEGHKVGDEAVLQLLLSVQTLSDDVALAPPEALPAEVRAVEHRHAVSKARGGDRGPKLALDQVR